MTDSVDVAVDGQGAGLSQVERVVDTFVAPNKTFTDILRSASWWLPFVLMVVVTLAMAFVIDRQVGFERAAENQIHQSPKQEESFSTLTEAQKAQQLRVAGAVTRYTTYLSFVIILIFVAAAALLYWASVNFGFGARTTYGQMFAVCMYAGLPRLLIGLLSIVTLLLGGSAESFDLRNPVGTNLAYYMPDAAPWLKVFLSFFDIIGLWQLALLIVGTAIVAKISRGKAATVIVGWWLVGMVVLVGITAATS
ncbi:YIP1 family protein [Edaphobacter bradus]|uniref:YIP1 family protein n=1 Tax=Edaphobacter bradus TaxID=2259016 RepID=UPI0021DF4DB4|nr:YIP1 family protein [Edaphobacter bradus]